MPLIQILSVKLIQSVHNNLHMLIIDGCRRRLLRRGGGERLLWIGCSNGALNRPEQWPHYGSDKTAIQWTPKMDQRCFVKYRLRHSLIPRV